MLAFGANAIAAYTLHQATAGVVTWDLLLLPFRALRGALGDPVASLIPILLYMLLIWGAMEWLRRKGWRSEEHTSELTSLMRISYAVFCLKKKNTTQKS